DRRDDGAVSRDVRGSRLPLVLPRAAERHRGAAMTTTVQIATGAYTSFGGATGVRLLELSLPDGADGAPTVRELAQIPATDPSYVRWSEDGTLLYAVQETSPAHLLAIRVPEQGTGAELAGELTLQGSGACHVALGRPGTLLVAD